MSPAQNKSTFHLVVASFVAGASAMVLAGFVAPVAIKGGLTIREAMAATVEAEAPAIEPLDVAAIQAQLADAERTMESTRAATDGAMERLDRLSGRR
jgi:hypothetical protein